MGFSPFDGFDGAMFTIVPVFIAIIFIIVFGSIIVRLTKNAAEWHRNNGSPVLNVDAVVVTKRADVSYHHHSGTSSSSSTAYYVTFELSGGERIELGIRDAEYGILVERDRGRLTFQGTRYIGFERNGSAL